jgi:hypothetical protein
VILNQGERREFLSCTREIPSFEKNVHALAAYTQESNIKAAF